MHPDIDKRIRELEAAEKLKAGVGSDGSGVSSDDSSDDESSEDSGDGSSSKSSKSSSGSSSDSDSDDSGDDDDDDERIVPLPASCLPEANGYKGAVVKPKMVSFAVALLASAVRAFVLLLA